MDCFIVFHCGFISFVARLYEGLLGGPHHNL